MKKLLSIIIILAISVFAATVTACKSPAEKISTYNITAKYDEDLQTLFANLQFTFYNSTENEITDAKFNLYGNAYREGASLSPVSQAYKDKAYYNGESFGEIKIINVENCSAWNVAGEDKNILCVNLLTPLYPDESVQININYELKLANVNHRTGVAENTVNLGNFYPILCAYTNSGYMECEYQSVGDPFVSDCANYVVNLDLPQGYVAATSGKGVSSTTSGERIKQSFELKYARDFAVVLSKDFKIESREVAGVQVYYYYYSDASPQALLTVAAESLEYFSQTFGNYVYPTLSVVQTGFCYGGMEYPALTMISDELDSTSAIYTAVHENAHQWWYAMVGSDQVNCAWQDEGLAEYSTLMFFEKHPNYGFTKTGMVGSATKSYRAYFSVYNQLFGNVNTAMNRPLSDYSSDYEYTNICYNKGLILFDTLKNSIGDEKFVQCLKNYYSANLYKIASVEDLYATFINSGTDLESFFTSFVEGKIII